MNIEDLYDQNTPENSRLIVSDLRSKTYDNIKELSDEAIRLRRHYKCSPNKVQLANIYNKMHSEIPHVNHQLFKKYFKVKETRSTSGVMVYILQLHLHIQNISMIMVIKKSNDSVVNMIVLIVLVN